MNAVLELLRKYKSHAIALVSAIFIWFFVITENYFEYIVRIPIVVVNLKQGTSVSNELPQNAYVRLRGRGRSLLRFLIFKDAKLELNLGRAEGRKIIKLSGKDVVTSGRSAEIEVMELVSPDTVTVFIEPFLTKQVPVRSQISIKTRPGYAIVGSIRIVPDSVLMEGPNSTLDTLTEVMTIPLALKDVKRPVKKEVELLLPDIPRIHLLSTKVTVLADVQMLMEKTITGVEVEPRNVPAGMKAFVIPSDLKLTIEGGVKLMTKISKKDIIAYIDLNKEWTDPKGYPAYIETPEGIRYRDVIPKRFKVVLEKNRTKN